jgi:hypothetical protein
MSASTKVGVLLAAAVAGWAACEFDLVSRSPPELTAVALRQFDGGAATDRVRHADAAKNTWLVLWPLALVTLAGLLFWDDLMAWSKKPSRGPCTPLLPGGEGGGEGANPAGQPGDKS